MVLDVDSVYIKNVFTVPSLSWDLCVQWHQTQWCLSRIVTNKYN